MFEDVLKPALYEQSKDLIAEARRAGCRIVLVTGALDFTMRPLARYLGADELIANKMQFVGGKATGKVIPPIIEGANKANAIRDYCVREGLSLAHCHGYSDSASDYAMLAIVGRPTAVNPDMRLRSLARAYNWPILDSEVTHARYAPHQDAPEAVRRGKPGRHHREGQPPARPLLR